MGETEDQGSEVYRMHDGRLAVNRADAEVGSTPAASKPFRGLNR